MVNQNLKFDIAVYFYQNYGICMESIVFESHMVGFERRHIRNLTKFLNSVAPHYGYEFLAIEQNEEQNQHLNLPEVLVKKQLVLLLTFW